MQTDPNLQIPLLVSGALLAAVGFLRLSRVGFRTMPAALALAVAALGAGVVAFGAALPRLDRAEVSAPAVTLEPVTDPSGPATIEGRIEGTVRTASGDALANVTVVLRRFEGTEPAATTETVTDADGRYAFPALEVSPRTAHVVSTDFEGATFRSELVVLGPHAEASAVDVVVAPPSDDPSVLRVEVDSTVLVGDELGVQAVQVLQLRNSSDEAYVGGLHLPLLDAASGFEVRRGLDRTQLRFAEDQLLSLQPVLPGRTEIVYTYGAPMPRSGLRFQREVRYPTDRFELLVGGEIAAIVSESLRADGEVGLGDDEAARTYRRYRAAGLDAGDEVEAALQTGRSSRIPAAPLVAIAAVVAVAILVLPLVRRRRHASVDRRPEPAAEPTPVPDER